MAAAERAVAPLASEDVAVPVGLDLPQICPAPAQGAPAENGALENGHTAEHAEISSPRALDELESTKEVAPAEPAPAESAPALQNGPVDNVATAADSAQPVQDATVPSSAPEDAAAGQPDEAGVPIVVAAEADTAEAKPEAEAEHVESSVGPEANSKKRSRPADEPAAPEQAPPEQAAAEAEGNASPEAAASEGEASRKKRKVAAAAEGAPAAAEEAPPAVSVSEQSAPAAEPKMQRKRKAASTDLDAVQAAGKASTTPESQPSKSLSRRSLRSSHAVQEDTAAAGEAVDSVSKPVPAAEADPGPAKAKAKPRRRGAAAELAALGQADVMPADSPRHASSAQQPASRRALRSQTAEPDQAATPRAEQPVPSKQPASKRALRSQGSMPRDGMLSREGSRAGTAAASPNEGGALLGSGQPGPGSLPGSAAVQRLLRRSMSPRRRTRSNAQEHIGAADVAAGGGCLFHALLQINALCTGQVKLSAVPAGHKK